MVAPILTVRIDWANDGSFSEAIDSCAGRVIDASWSRGRSADFGADAIGTATLLLDNFDDRYTSDRNWHDNPSFEVDTAGWSAAAITNLIAAGTSIAQVVDNATPATGIRAGEAVLTASLNSGVGYSIPYRFLSGVTYSASVWLKSMSGSLTVRAGLASAGTPSDIASSGLDITTSWALSTLTWTPKADRTDVVFFIRTTTAAAATVRIDGVNVNPGALANPYIEGPTKGQLVPSRPVHIYSTYSSVDDPQFYGFIQRVSPNYADRTVAVTCYDPLAAMGRLSIAAPQRSRTHREIRLDALNAYGAGWRNMLESNPSFEVDTAGWATTTGTLTRITTDAAPVAGAGTACAELVSGAAAVVTSPLVPAISSPGLYFRGSIWLKLISGAASVTVSVYDNAGFGISNYKAVTAILTVGNWTKIEDVWQAGGPLVAGIRFRLDVGPSTTLRIDAAQLTMGPEARPFAAGVGAAGTLGFSYLDDPSFEVKPAVATWRGLRDNLVSNSGFEVDTAGWSADGDAFVSPAGIARDISRSQSGVASGLLSSTNNVSLPNKGVSYALPGVFRAGIAYTATAFYQGPSSAADLEIGLGSAGTPADVASKPYAVFGAPPTWKYMSVTWTPTADRTDAHLFFRTQSANIQPLAYIDSVMVFEAGIDIASVYQPSFGFGGPPREPPKVVRTAAASGSRALEVSTTAKNKSGVGYALLGAPGFLAVGRVTFYANVTYTFVCSVRLVDGNAALAIGLGSENTPADSVTVPFVATGSWVQRSVTWTPTADRTDVTCFIRMDSGSAASIFQVDACALYPGSTAIAAEPGFANLPVEDIRAPNAVLTGTVTSILAAVNAATASRHWIEPTMVAPWWTYSVETAQTADSKAFAEAIVEDIADATNFDLDDSSIINVQVVEGSGYYVDQTTGAIYDAVGLSRTVVSDGPSLRTFGRRDGKPIGGALVESPPLDATFLSDLGAYIVRRYKDGAPRPRIRRTNIWPSQLQRRLNDVVTLTFARQRLLAQPYAIVSLTTKVSESGQRWDTEYTLEQYPYGEAGNGGLLTLMLTE